MSHGCGLKYIKREMDSPDPVATFQGAVRFNELQRLLGTITTKTLSQQLRQLEEQQIILRTVYPETPPKVEYSLTDNR